MTKEEIEEGNKLIAEFMEATIDEYPKSLPRWFYWHGSLNPHEMQYNHSWDWLMPVVEKIDGMEHTTIIGGGSYWGNYCNIIYGVDRMETDDTKAMGMDKTKIEAVYKAIIQFIKWHNTHTQTTHK